MELKAKNISIIIKIVDVLFIVVCSILKWRGVFNAEIRDICIVGGVIGAIFGDVSINTALDKFKKVNE